MLYRNRFLILRRLVQLSLLFLYLMGNYAGWTVLQGNLSNSLILGTIPMSDPFAILQILLAGGIVAFNALIGALVVLLVYGMFVGRAFCAWICPMNMVTDLANWLRKVLQIDETERRIWMNRNIRYWILGLTLILSLMLALPAFEFISPIAMLHRGIIFGMGAGFAAVVIVFLFDLFVHRNGFCGYVCPLGGFYSLVTRFSLLRVKHDQEKCTLCMKCKEICPEKEVLHMVGKRSEFVTMGECINCGRCIEVCDDSALSFSIRTFVENKKEENDEKVPATSV